MLHIEVFYFEKAYSGYTFNKYSSDFLGRIKIIIYEYRNDETRIKLINRDI